MAVSPDEIIKLNKEQIHEQLKKLEGEIDKKILLDAQTGGVKIYPGNEITFSIPMKTGDAVIEAIIHLYKEAGWKDVILRHNQKDGKWLSFIF